MEYLWLTSEIIEPKYIRRKISIRQYGVLPFYGLGLEINFLHIIISIKIKDFCFIISALKL